MRVDYILALTYPFRPENRVNCLLIPALIALVYTLLSTTLDTLPLWGNRQPINPLDTDVLTPGFLARDAVRLLTLQVFFAFLSGYNWHLTKTFQEDGFSATAPSWLGMRTYWLDGLKLLLFFIVVFIPVYGLLLLSGEFLRTRTVTFALLLLGSALAVGAGYFLASPLLGTMYIKAAPTRTLRELFNVPGAWPIALRHYGKMLLIKLLFYIITFVSLLFLLIAGLFPEPFRFILTFLIGYFNSSVIMVIFSHVLTQMIMPGQPGQVRSLADRQPGDSRNVSG